MEGSCTRDVYQICLLVAFDNRQQAIPDRLSPKLH